MDALCHAVESYTCRKSNPITDMFCLDAEKFLEALESLTKELQVPTLREYGLDLEQFAAMEDKMAEDSVASGSPANCWKVLTKEEQIKIYDILRSK